MEDTLIKYWSMGIFILEEGNPKQWHLSLVLVPQLCMGLSRDHYYVTRMIMAAPQIFVELPYENWNKITQKQNKLQQLWDG